MPGSVNIGLVGVVGPGDLVALRLAPGPAWLTALEGTVSVGAAALPLDDRLAPAELRAVLEAGRPTHAYDGRGLARLAGGMPVDPGTALVVPTSGTGGRPKLVELTRSGVEAAVRASADALGAGADERWLCCLPPAHVGGLLVLLRGVLTGAPVVVHRRFDPAAVAGERALDYVSVVPTMLARLLDAGAVLSRFRTILVGGAALPEELAERARGAGAHLVATYGCTESCGGVVYDGLPLPGTDVALGERGEVLLRGPTLMRGYLRDPRATDAVLADGWLRTGDVGTFDPGGALVVRGRLDEAIRPAGEEVWPDEVEAALRDHPLVADVAVAGRPDGEWGERVVAFVVPRDPGAPPSLEELRDHAARRIARFKAPRELVLRDELPRTPSGKVRRSVLG